MTTVNKCCPHRTPLDLICPLCIEEAEAKAGSVLAVSPPDFAIDWKARAEKAEADSRVLREALTALLERHADLIHCVSFGGWNPENEREVKKARAALSSCPSE